MVLLVALGWPAAAGAQPVPQPSVTLDGPSTTITALSDVAVARDGGGAVIYLKSGHVFVSRIVEGTFAPPEQVDIGLASGSSQPVLAAGSNGLLLIAFINGGQLYVVSRPSVTAPYRAPQPLAAGASNPALAISSHDKGYLAFAVTGSGANDVRAAYYFNGGWALESAPLDAVPTDNAGVSAGAPKVAAANDGVGIVVWGEANHVYSRRVWATSPSVVFEQADVPSVSGAGELAADSPTIATGDDSSYADVAFSERVAGTPSQRVVLRRLRGSRYENPVGADGLVAGSSDGAIMPQVVETGATHGLLTTVRSTSNQVYAGELGDGGLLAGFARVDTLGSNSAPFAVPATTGSFSGLVAWQRDPGTPFPKEIRERYWDGTNFGPDVVISSPAAGPTNAAAGLAAAGDIAGDLAIAWTQGTPPVQQISAALLYYPPGSFGPQAPTKYATHAAPTFTWSAAREQWGPVTYRLTIDGRLAGQSTATSVRSPVPLADGPHTWQVSAVNQVGLVTAARAATVWVDTVGPSLQFTLTGRQRRRSVLRLAVRTTDAPVPGVVGSGVASVIVRWGDGKAARIRHGATHAYARSGTYRLTVVVSDRAGNTTRIVRRVRVV